MSSRTGGIRGRGNSETGVTRLCLILCIMALAAVLVGPRRQARADSSIGPLRYSPLSERLKIQDAPPDIRDFYVQPHAPPYPRDLQDAHGVPPWLKATVDGEYRADRVAHAVLPQDADNRVKQFTVKNLVLFNRSSPADAPLLVWLTGTGGTPLDAGLFLPAAADAGYRVISLEFDDLPAGTGLCDGSADPACFWRYRSARVLGTDMAPDLEHAPAESIVTRLTMLLTYLDTHYPDEDWRAYLHEGAPDWPRIAMSGQSMGAGMAAFIGKRVPLARVILSSSPWDHHTPGDALAPWLEQPGATPVERWVGVYHQREPMAPVLARAYAALGLRKEQVLVATLLPDAMISAPASSDRFHGCWFGGPVPLEKNWHPTNEVKQIWSFLLGRKVP